MHIAYCILSVALSTASSFRIWNSSTGILSLPGASMRNSARGKGHEEGGSAYAKAGSSLRSPPGNSRASTPKPESAYFRLCALTYTSDFTGAVPHYLSLKKRANLQLQLIKFLGLIVFQPTNSFGSPLACLNRFFPATCDCSEPPNCESQEMF